MNSFAEVWRSGAAPRRVPTGGPPLKSDGPDRPDRPVDAGPGTPIRTILADDEPLALRGLEIRLRRFEDIEIVATCENGRRTIEAIRRLKPDLVFIDIQMPGAGGFDVIDALGGEARPLIVLVTAYELFASRALETGALDYLHKPLDDGLLEAAVIRARAALGRGSPIQ